MMRVSQLSAGLFDRLADLIHSMEVINKNCQFILIPGPHDLSQGMLFMIAVAMPLCRYSSSFLSFAVRLQHMFPFKIHHSSLHLLRHTLLFTTAPAARAVDDQIERACAHHQLCQQSLSLSLLRVRDGFFPRGLAAKDATQLHPAACDPRDGCVEPAFSENCD
jgi:hypothetical protein